MTALVKPWMSMSNSYSVEGVTDVREAMEVVGMNWEVEKSQAYDKVGDDFVPVKNVFNIRRTDNHYVLGQTGKTWEPLQNVESFDFFQSFIDEGMFELERVGYFNGGGKTFLIAKSNDDYQEIRLGDKIINYIILTNGHDGKTSVNAALTPIRIVCMNQLPGLNKGAFDSVVSKIRHSRKTSGIVSNLKDALMYDMQNEASHFENFRKMSAIQISGKALEEYVQKFLKIKDMEKVSTKSKNIFDKIVDLCKNGTGNTGETVWDAMNGVTEYLSHIKGHNAENRFRNLLSGVDLSRAYNLAMDLAAQFSVMGAG